MQKFLLHLSFISLSFGCGQFWEDEGETLGPGSPRPSRTPRVPKERREVSGLDTIMYARRIATGKALIIATRPGDRLIITLEGTLRVPEFYEVIRPYDAFYSPLNADCLANTSLKECLPINTHPNCFVRFRNVNHSKDQKLILPDDTHLLAIKIEMSGKFYSVGEIIQHDKTKIVTEFLVTEEMMDDQFDYTNAYFVVQQSMPSKTVNIHDLEFADQSQCPETTERLRSQPYYSASWMEYTVSVARGEL